MEATFWGYTPRRMGPTVVRATSFHRRRSREAQSPMQYFSHGSRICSRCRPEKAAGAGHDILDFGCAFGLDTAVHFMMRWLDIEKKRIGNSMIDIAHRAKRVRLWRAKSTSPIGQRGRQHLVLCRHWPLPDRTPVSYEHRLSSHSGDALCPIPPFEPYTDSTAVSWLERPHVP